MSRTAKTAVITGASRGIGAAIAVQAARSGYDVCLNYSSSRERAEAVAREVESTGQKALVVKADMTVESEIVGLFETVDRDLGRLDVLINNAAVDYDTLIADFQADGLERVFRTNVFGPFFTAREAIRRMATSHGGAGGTIVNIGSISARYGGLPGDVIYSSSKGALDAFTLGLARELGRESIRVVCVRPGLTNTEMFTSAVGIQKAQEIADSGTMLGRMGEPIEVADFVLWVCSDKASYVTGSIHDVSGGR